MLKPRWILGRKCEEIEHDDKVLIMEMMRIAAYEDNKNPNTYYNKTVHRILDYYYFFPPTSKSIYSHCVCSLQLNQKITKKMKQRRNKMKPRDHYGYTGYTIHEKWYMARWFMFCFIM